MRNAHINFLDHRRIHEKAMNNIESWVEKQFGKRYILTPEIDNRIKHEIEKEMQRLFKKEGIKYVPDFRNRRTQIDDMIKGSD